MMTDFSREGGDPPNNENQARRKPRPFSPKVFADDLMVVLSVAAQAKDPEARWRLLVSGCGQLIATHSLLNHSARK